MSNQNADALREKLRSEILVNYDVKVPADDPIIEVGVMYLACLEEARQVLVTDLKQVLSNQSKLMQHDLTTKISEPLAKFSEDAQQFSDAKKEVMQEVFLHSKKHIADEFSMHIRNELKLISDKMAGANNDTNSNKNTSYLMPVLLFSNLLLCLVVIALLFFK